MALGEPRGERLRRIGDDDGGDGEIVCRAHPVEPGRDAPGDVPDEARGRFGARARPDSNDAQGVSSDGPVAPTRIERGSCGLRSETASWGESNCVIITHTELCGAYRGPTEGRTGWLPPPQTSRHSSFRRRLASRLLQRVRGWAGQGQVRPEGA